VSEDNKQFSGSAITNKRTNYGKRTIYPDTVSYSWWSYMYHAREKNVGWRIDYFVVSERIMPKVKDSFILGDVMGSDHCPVGIILE
jgi:exodeoxyribonuclease-3